MGFADSMLTRVFNAARSTSEQSPLGQSLCELAWVKLRAAQWVKNLSVPTLEEAPTLEKMEL